jgi:hypothetical protein
MNIDTLLDSPAFWIGVFVFFVVLGKMFEIMATTGESKPKSKKGK